MSSSMSDERKGPEITEGDDPPENPPTTGVSRRDLLKSAAALGVTAAVVGPGLSAAAAVTNPQIAAIGPTYDGSILRFVNGNIHTMDDNRSVASSVTIQNGHFTAVGNQGGPGGGRGVTTINLRGATVIPGLIESHTHFVSLANRPGYHVAELELAKNIAEVQGFLAARRAVGDIPEGGFITAMGGWNSGAQWEERRLPTLDELDEAVSDRPVFLFERFSGPASVNTLGKQFFEGVTDPPVAVNADGSITGAGARAALYHLRIRQTFEDKLRSTRDAMAFTAKLGITSLLDQTLVAVDEEPQPNHFLANLNHYRMYDAWLELHRRSETFVRLQINFLHNQGFIGSLGPDLADQLPELRDRLKNQFPFFGDAMLRTGGIGEWAAPFSRPDQNADNYAVWYEAQRLVAQAGWRNENSEGAPEDIEFVVSAYEDMESEFGISHLRWGLQHGDFATPNQLARLADLNVSISTSGFRWQNTDEDPRPANDPVGPLFPQLLASDVHIGLHEDGVHIAPHNAFYAMHYATTGLNARDVQVNPGQQISRDQALFAYTRENAWYMNREDDLGSIEVGKRADMLVLDRDYFSVSDGAMRDTLPVMTLVDGEIVHETS